MGLGLCNLALWPYYHKKRNANNIDLLFYGVNYHSKSLQL